MVNQVECHPYFTQNTLLQYCRQNDIVMTAYSPLASRNRLWAPDDEVILLKHPVITEIARQHAKTPVQVVLRWHFQRGVVAIPRALRSKHGAENADIFDFELSAAECHKIQGLDAHKRLYIPYVDGKAWCSDHPFYPF